MGKKDVVLVVAAHGDDEVLGAGASIAMHCAKGDMVHVLIMADGVSSRYFDPQTLRVKNVSKVKKLVERRGKETVKALAILGVPKSNIHLLNLADQRMDTYPFLTLVKYIERIRDMIQPDIVYTHFWGDLNLDHRLTSEAVSTAFRPYGLSKDVALYQFEVPESTGLSARRGIKFDPNFKLNAEPWMDLKLKALSVYESESRIYPHPRSAQFVKQIKYERFIKVI